MKRFLFLLMSTLFIMFIFGCELAPVKPEQPLELDATVAALAPFGWNANQIITNTANIEEMTNIASDLKKDGSATQPGVGALAKQATSIMQEAYRPELMRQGLQKSNGDSLLVFEDNKITGVRKALYYNAETGMARYYEVKYKFADWRNIVYDSTTLRANLNFTPDNPFDDVLTYWHETQRFKDSFFIQSIIQSLIVTDFDGKDVTGAKVKKVTNYQPDRFLTTMKQNIQIHPDQSGTLHEELSYNDATRSYKTVTFYADNTGEFEELKRDGTVVSGRFNGVDDDGIGYFEETTDFPVGRYVDRVDKAAHLLVNNSDQSTSIRYAETVLLSSGVSNTDSVRIKSSEEAGTKYTTLECYKHNGEHGALSVTESETGSSLTGNWTTKDGYYIALNAEYYVDKSGHIHYEVFASETAFNNGDDPLILADYYFSPDSSGNGTIAHEGVNYDISFNDSGKADISANEQTKTIELYQ
ncbi:hypothetical protein JW960_02585 [candidate division KSB1 bacterium]|nr:hypothetical protein [candidate division KSB1 bacterium]